MTKASFQRVAWLLGAALAGSAHAATHICKDSTGRTTVQDVPCPVEKAPPAPPRPKLACALDGERLEAAIRLERQFLTRYPDETTHRRLQVADLQPIVERIERGHARYRELAAQRATLDRELPFYEGKQMPSPLKTKVDANDAQFAAVADILRGAAQEVGDVRSRYECERATFAKLWSGAAPGSSACDRPACAPP